MDKKEFLYVGFYHDTDNNFILKIGTTNDLKKRQSEHNRNYRRAKEYTMPLNGNFEYILTCHFGWPRTVDAARISIIPPPQHFVNRHFAQKLNVKFSRICATFSAKNSCNSFKSMVL